MDEWINYAFTESTNEGMKQVNSKTLVTDHMAMTRINAIVANCTAWLLVQFDVAASLPAVLELLREALLREALLCEEPREPARDGVVTYGGMEDGSLECFDIEPPPFSHLQSIRQRTVHTRVISYRTRFTIKTLRKIPNFMLSSSYVCSRFILSYEVKIS